MPGMLKELVSYSARSRGICRKFFHVDLEKNACVEEGLRRARAEPAIKRPQRDIFFSTEIGGTHTADQIGLDQPIPLVAAAARDPPLTAPRRGLVRLRDADPHFDLTHHAGHLLYLTRRLRSANLRPV